MTAIQQNDVNICTINGRNISTIYSKNILLRYKQTNYHAMKQMYTIICFRSTKLKFDSNS